MKVTLLGSNLPSNTKIVREEVLESIGISASICYMSDTYQAIVERSKEKNIEIALLALGNGHHSVADHIQISFLLENSSKILAMILNSIGCYGTSEKSGRYTVMKNCSQDEKELYDKWTNILSGLISKAYPKIKEKQVTKLAMENARLFLSIFAPSTVMQYTVNIKDANYIIDWCERFQNVDVDNYYYNTLKAELLDFSKQLKGLIYIEELRDHKNRGFEFVNTSDFDDILACHEFGLAYTTYYEGSFTMIAQEERHRTLIHTMYFNGEAKKFYVPEIIEDEKLMEEWLNDMQKVAHLVPQGTMVGVREQGTLERFKLKCTERMCGRAQLEIMRQTVGTYIDYVDELQMKINEGRDNYQEALASLRELDSCVKCGFMTCKEPCMWGRKANFRKI